MEPVDAERARQLSLFRPLGTSPTLPLQGATKGRGCYPVALPLALRGVQGGQLAGRLSPHHVKTKPKTTKTTKTPPLILLISQATNVTRVVTASPVTEVCEPNTLVLFLFLFKFLFKFLFLFIFIFFYFDFIFLRNFCMISYVHALNLRSY